MVENGLGGLTREKLAVIQYASQKMHFLFANHAVHTIDHGPGQSTRAIAAADQGQQ
jgi:hypothetical protein